MTITLSKLSYDIVAGAQVSFKDDTARNPSEAGISGRISMRPVLREYMLSVSLAQSREMVAIIMSHRGGRYPFALRDYADNYQLTNEILPHTGTVALMGRTWAPATGSGLSVFERILVPDTTQTALVVSVNGSPLSVSPAGYSLSDFGKINISGLMDGDVVTVTGQYMVPVCIVDAPSTTIISNSNGTTLHRFSEIRLEQIFENELIALTA